MKYSMPAPVEFVTGKNTMNNAQSGFATLLIKRRKRHRHSHSQFGILRVFRGSNTHSEI